MNFQGILQFLLNPDLPEWMVYVKIIFLATSLFFFGFILFAIARTTWIRWLALWDLREYLTYRHFSLVGVEKKWAKVKERLKIGTESEAKLAIIEADKLLVEILDKMGYLGESVEEKLEKININILGNLKDVKEVHRICTHIIHDPTYRLEVKEAKNILSVYEKALMELQAL